MQLTYSIEFQLKQLSVAILLDTLRDPRVISSTTPLFGQFLRREMPSFLRMLRDKVRDIVFEKECVNIPTVAIDNDQTSIIDIV